MAHKIEKFVRQRSAPLSHAQENSGILSSLFSFVYRMSRSGNEFCSFDIVRVNINVRAGHSWSVPLTCVKERSAVQTGGFLCL